MSAALPLDNRIAAAARLVRLADALECGRLPDREDRAEFVCAIRRFQTGGCDLLDALGLRGGKGQPTASMQLRRHRMDNLLARAAAIWPAYKTQQIAQRIFETLNDYRTARDLIFNGTCPHPPHSREALWWEILRETAGVIPAQPIIAKAIYRTSRSRGSRVD